MRHEFFWPLFFILLWFTFIGFCWAAVALVFVVVVEWERDRRWFS